MYYEILKCSVPIAKKFIPVLYQLPKSSAVIYINVSQGSEEILDRKKKLQAQRKVRNLEANLKLIEMNITVQSEMHAVTSRKISLAKAVGAVIFSYGMGYAGKSFHHCI